MLMYLTNIDYFRQINRPVSPQLISFLFAPLKGRNVKYNAAINLNCTCGK